MDGKTIVAVLRSILLSALIVGCAAMTPQGQPIAPETLFAAIRGNTQVGSSTAGGNWRIHVAEDLTRRGVVFTPNRQFTITGQVAATENGVCSSSPELRNGEVRCYQIFRDGDVYQSVYNGSVDSTFRIVAGNSYGL